MPLSSTVTVTFSPLTASLTWIVPGVGVYFAALSKSVHSKRLRLE
jgi:hypothetical protein